MENGDTSDRNKSKLTRGAQRLVDSALEDLRKDAGSTSVQGSNHWLLMLAKRHGAMAAAMTVEDFDASHVIREASSKIQENDCGETLPSEKLVELAVQRAKDRGKDKASERDLAMVILEAAGYELTSPGQAEYVGRPARSEGGSEAVFAGKATRPTPTLNKIGIDLTKAYEDGKLNPVIGRDQELETVIETLCRATKRNPILVGPAGVGKTAIIEGLAGRAVRGELPEVLKGMRIVSLPITSIVAGSGVFGSLEEKMQQVIQEASQDGIVLFIDEAHTILTAGNARVIGDILKPALARGDLACIAATTDEEFRRIFEEDKALERRFQPVPIQELNRQETLDILKALRDVRAEGRGVHVGDEVLEFLVHFADDFLHNRYFPDKGVDLLEQCIAHGLANDAAKVSKADAQAVAQRLIGMPLALDERLDSLKTKLADGALLMAPDIEALMNRLNVTLRRLDMSHVRPNAVVLLAGDAASHCEPLAEATAMALFGSADHVIHIDFGSLVHDTDVRMLLGSPPSYVGYHDALPLDRVAQMPWCVLSCGNVHQCHPHVRQILTQALTTGYLTKADGRRLFLSDVVALISVPVSKDTKQAVGFARQAESPTAIGLDGLRDLIGQDLLDVVDVVVTEIPGAQDRQRVWLESELLPELASRYRDSGLDVRFDPSFLAWLVEKQTSITGRSAWERFVDENLSPLLIEHFPDAVDDDVKPIRILCEQGAVKVELCTEERKV